MISARNRNSCSEALNFIPAADVATSSFGWKSPRVAEAQSRTFFEELVFESGFFSSLSEKKVRWEIIGRTKSRR